VVVVMKPQPAATELPPLEDLFREHSDAVFMAAHRVTGNAMDAEDVLQTVFLRMARRRTDIADVERPGAYLRHAAVNAALDIVRSRERRRETAPLEDDWVAVSGDEASPEDKARGRELKDRLRAALGEVSPRSAEMFALRYLEGFANAEIAQMLGTSPSAVGVTLHRTRRRLRRELRDD